MFASGWSAGAYILFLGRRIARIYPLYLAATAAAFFLVIAGCP
jgi:peptidoglycan/LPS O-acetylase OafA/YrhL